MKKLGLLSLIALLTFGLAFPAFAGDAVQGGQILGTGTGPIKTLPLTADTSSAGDFGPDMYILGFKLYADDAGDSCGLYDTALLGSAAIANLIDEWVEATDEETNIQLWPFPYRLTTDLTVVTDGICIVYYQ